MDSSDAERKLEKFVFHGVPETPESIYQRDDRALFTERSTGKALKPSGGDKRRGKWVVLGRVIVDRKTETETFIRAKKKKKSKS